MCMSTSWFHGSSTSQPTLQDLKDLQLMSWCQIVQSPRLSESALFLQHVKDQQHIRQVVIMFLDGWMANMMSNNHKLKPKW